MFIGHHAVAFAAKKFAPHTSLGTLVAAPDMNFIAIGGSFAVWLFVLWSWWLDRHRTADAGEQNN